MAVPVWQIQSGDLASSARATVTRGRHRPPLSGLGRECLLAGLLTRRTACPRLLPSDQEHESHDRKSGPQDREQRSYNSCYDASSAMFFGGWPPAVIVGNSDVVLHLIRRGCNGTRLAHVGPAHQARADAPEHQKDGLTLGGHPLTSHTREYVQGASYGEDRTGAGCGWGPR